MHSKMYNCTLQKFEKKKLRRKNKIMTLKIVRRKNLNLKFENYGDKK